MNEAQRARYEQADRIAVDLAHYIENEEGALSAYVLLKIRDAVTAAWAAATADENEACATCFYADDPQYVDDNLNEYNSYRDAIARTMEFAQARIRARQEQEREKPRG